MVDETRRKLLKTGAAAAAVAAVRPVLAQQNPQAAPAGKFYERGPVRIYYEEAGSGFPLLMLPPGGLNSRVALIAGSNPYPGNAINEFKGEYRCITADLRNAPGGQSTGPVEVDRPWDAHADDHLGLMDHLGIDRFAVMGFCIGGPFIWNLVKRAPNRIAAAVVAQPVGFRPEMRDRKFAGSFWATWPGLVTAKWPQITMQAADQFVTRMFETNPEHASVHAHRAALEGEARNFEVWVEIGGESRLLRGHVEPLRDASQAIRGAGTRLFRTTGPAKYRTAISKNRMKKISMLMPWIVSMR